MIITIKRCRADRYNLASLMHTIMHTQLPLTTWRDNALFDIQRVKLALQVLELKLQLLLNMTVLRFQSK